MPLYLAVHSSEQPLHTREREREREGERVTGCMALCAACSRARALTGCSRRSTMDAVIATVTVAEGHKLSDDDDAGVS